VRAGDRVQLRPPAEILATLDKRSSLDGVPFMPEMLGFFGRTFTVVAQVERACDTIGGTGVRRLKDTVMLDDLRCDGSGHAGCQAQCRLYWKEAWLCSTPIREDHGQESEPSSDAFFELKRLAETNVNGADTTTEEPTFRCQATELLRASEPVGWWSVRSLMREVTGGNVGPWRFVRVMTRIIVEEIARRLGLLSQFPFPPERLSEQRSVAAAPLRGFRPGELVKIRTKGEIRETIAPNGKNRGLWFDREMLPYCGHTARVKTKVERFIDEGSGRLVELASDCYILDDVVCESSRSDGRWFCPRAIYPWWRECWLRPLEQDGAEAAIDAQER
jgi:hypothetical protein